MKALGWQAGSQVRPSSSSSPYFLASLHSMKGVAYRFVPAYRRIGFAKVTEEISEIAGVEDVDVVVETGAVTVTSATPLDESAVRAAVEEAGYALV